MAASRPYAGYLEAKGGEKGSSTAVTEISRLSDRGIVKIGLEGKFSHMPSIMQACRATPSVGSTRNGLKGQHAHLIGTREISNHHPSTKSASTDDVPYVGAYSSGRIDRPAMRSTAPKIDRRAGPNSPSARGEELPHEARCCRSGSHLRPVTAARQLWVKSRSRPNGKSAGGGFENHPSADETPH
jgi:hypothetical protein